MDAAWRAPLDNPSICRCHRLLFGVVRHRVNLSPQDTQKVRRLTPPAKTKIGPLTLAPPGAGVATNRANPFSINELGRHSVRLGPRRVRDPANGELAFGVLAG